MIPMATFLKSLRNLMVAGLKNTAGFLRQRVPSSIGELKAANLKIRPSYCKLLSKFELLIM